MWLDALDDRNLTAHTYKEEVAQTVEHRVRERYYPIIAALYKTLTEKKAAVEQEASE